MDTISRSSRADELSRAAGAHHRAARSRPTRRGESRARARRSSVAVWGAPNRRVDGSRRRIRRRHRRDRATISSRRPGHLPRRSPWLAETHGRSPGPRYVLVGSPITPDATTLPVRATFVPWLGRILTERLVGEPGQVLGAARRASCHARAGRTQSRDPTASVRTLADVLDAPTRAGTFFSAAGGASEP